LTPRKDRERNRWANFATTRIANNQASMYGAVDLANEDIGSLLQRALP